MRGSMTSVVLPSLFVGLLAGCTAVDSTEYCVLTRYGNVVDERMDNGLHPTPFTEATCFTMTDQVFPIPDDDAEAEIIEAQTADPVTVQGDVAITWAYDPATIFQVFQEKRTPEAVEVEVMNAIREGYRNALAGWTVSRIFSAERANLDAVVQQQIQEEIGNRAVVKSVFVRDIRIPEAIEEARIAAARQAQVLAQAQAQAQIDSVNAATLVRTAEANAEAKRLEAQSYAANPALLELEIAKATANGLAQACRQATTCVIGGSIADLRPLVP
jgi:regulator of protease activity HflC (stomatin/prohibitin superfamily)